MIKGCITKRLTEENPSATHLKGSDVSPDDVAGVVSLWVQLPCYTEQHSPPLAVKRGQHKDVAALDQLGHQRILS